MTPSAREWIEKAEADYLSAGREYRARTRPNYDATCFFAQQCVEKYLKGRLVEEGVDFPKTHDLENLMDLALPRDRLLECLRPLLADLTSYAVAFRYPGEKATREMARTALANAKKVRAEMRQRMGLPKA